MPGPARHPTLGLLGGIGPFATARYYTEIVAACENRGGGYPEIVVLSMDFERFTELEERRDRSPYIGEIVDSLRRLSAAGAHFAAMAANSPHVVLDSILARSSLPLISIVDPVVDEVRRSGVKSVLVLGIRPTLEGKLYVAELEAEGVHVRTPSESNQAVTDAIIFQELGRGSVRAASRERLLEIIGRSSAEAALLACTELSLLLRPGSAGVPLIDSLALHIGAIVNQITGQALEEGQTSAKNPVSTRRR